MLLKSIAVLLLNFGAAMVILAGWIALWDIRNEFLPMVLAAALLLLGVGLVME